jgi:hypothetical protein
MITNPGTALQRPLLAKGGVSAQQEFGPINQTHTQEITSSTLPTFWPPPARMSAAYGCMSAKPNSDECSRVPWPTCSSREQGEIGPDLFRHACLTGIEGIVSKHRKRAYRAGRHF